MRSPIPSSNLTDAQEITLLVCVFVSATLSIFGSSCIIYIILSRKKYVNTYNRLMLALSCCDVVNSIFVVLNPVLTPSWSDRLLARGNDATCSVAGFFMQFSFSVAFYNGMLSLYYLLTIRMGISQERVSKRYEPFMHAIAIGYPLITAIIGVALGVYSELDFNFGCWVNDYPAGCDASDTVSCVSEQIGWIFGGIPILSSMVFITISNFLLYCKVRQLQGRMASYHSGGIDQNKRTRAVAIQGFLYVATFYNSWVWAMIVQLVESGTKRRDEESSIFVIRLLTSIFYPLQGFWNMFIYARPRYLRIREQRPEETRVLALYIALFGEEALGESFRVSGLLRSALSVKLPIGGFGTRAKKSVTSAAVANGDAHQPDVQGGTLSDSEAALPTIREHISKGGPRALSFQRITAC